jgi:hypothetical protein
MNRERGMARCECGSGYCLEEIMKFIYRLVATFLFLVTLATSGSALAAPVMTRFSPTTHGYKFANQFIVQTQIAGLNGPTFNGLCGGMAYSALDYFNGAIRIPQQDFLPAEGTILQSYIQRRQNDSTFPNADKWAELFFNPGGARNREFFNWGVQFGGGRLGELKGKIDRGEPVPLGLYECGNDCGCPGGCPGSHQVLAIGYDLGRYSAELGPHIEDVKIFVYDSNFPGRTMTLRPNVAGAMYGYVEAPAQRWRTYFTDMKYSRSTPPVVSIPTNQLVAKFRTGGDDLRGGNDNVHLVLLMKDGRQIRFENVNGLRRWVDWSTQNVSRPLAARFRVEDLAGIRLETTFGGGFNGDNWNLDEFSLNIRVSGVAREVVRLQAAPLVRFTGDRKVFEHRL